MSESSAGLNINEDTVGVDVSAIDGAGFFKCFSLNKDTIDRTRLHM